MFQHDRQGVAYRKKDILEQVRLNRMTLFYLYFIVTAQEPGARMKRKPIKYLQDLSMWQEEVSRLQEAYTASILDSGFWLLSSVLSKSEIKLTRHEG